LRVEFPDSDADLIAAAYEAYPGDLPKVRQTLREQSKNRRDLKEKQQNEERIALDTQGPGTPKVPEPAEGPKLGPGTPKVQPATPKAPEHAEGPKLGPGTPKAPTGTPRVPEPSGAPKLGPGTPAGASSPAKPSPNPVNVSAVGI
jgi:hypothetical protein